MMIPNGWRVLPGLEGGTPHLRPPRAAVPMVAMGLFRPAGVCAWFGWG